MILGDPETDFVCEMTFLKNSSQFNQLFFNFSGLINVTFLKNYVLKNKGFKIRTIKIAHLANN